MSSVCVLEALGGHVRTSKSQAGPSRETRRGTVLGEASIASGTVWLSQPTLTSFLCGAFYTHICHLDTTHHKALPSTTQLTEPCSQTCVTVN